VDTGEMSGEKAGLTAGAILVGGRGSRLGVAKPRALVGGVPLLERVLRAVRAATREVFLVGAWEGDLACPGLAVFPDEVPNAGPIGGLYTAVRHCSASACLVLAADMPFVSPALLQYLASKQDEAAAIVPRTVHGAHPLHAVYSAALAPRLSQFIAQGGRALHRFLETVSVRYVEADEIARFGDSEVILMNVNTPEELARAQAIAQRLERETS